MTNVIVQEIPYGSVQEMFSPFAEQKWSILLESALYNSEYGRYSYIAIDPFKTVWLKNSAIFVDGIQQDINPLIFLKELLKDYSLPTIPDLPPFQTGIAGSISYDFFQYLENVNCNNIDEMNFPDLAFGIYDLVISFDHMKKQAWIISTGWPEPDLDKRFQRAQQRCAWLQQIISSAEKYLSSANTVIDNTQIQSNFSRHAYTAAVQKVIDYILAGDIFEANISQRFLAPLPENLTPFELYCRLQKINPAPFASYFNLGELCVVSASPERFIKLADGKVETRPIKGTRRRGVNSDQDKIIAELLVTSEKDRAENIMIVDLLRNDLSKVCREHTVKVTKLCGLETYPTVHHLVSVIEGELKPDYDAIDLIMAAFPGGSVTGAPKVRAMQIIAELEPNKRGIYCGNLGYISFNGNMDTSIAIRTFTVKDGMVSFQTGGAVIADSEPFAEYEETLAKAFALNCALTQEA